MKRILFAALSLALTHASTRAADQYIPPQIPPPFPEFAGFYVAGGAGYGVSVTRDFIMNANIPTPCCFGAFGFASGEVAPQGSFASAITGYNIQYGAFLAGLELAGRWGKEGADGLPASSTFVTLGGATGKIDSSYRFRSDSGANLAARVGLVYGRTLIFAKVGAGVAQAEDSYSFNGSGTVCVSLRFVGNTPECTGVLPVGSANITIARWSPSMVAGVGIEHNIGRFFVRAGAELEGITGLKGGSGLTVQLAPGGSATGNAFSEPFWTTRGTALVGFRF